MVLRKFHDILRTCSLYLAEPFTLLDRHRHRWILVGFSGTYSILFMNLFVPFNVNTWNNSSLLPQYLSLSGYGTLGMLVLIISQFCLRPLFKFECLTVKKFLLWFVLEVTVLALVMQVFYGDMAPGGWEFLRELGLSFRYTGLVITLPYSMVLLWLYIQKQQAQIDIFSARQTTPAQESGRQAVSIIDENEKPVLTVSLSNLLFIKSEDNYVSVFFMKDGEARESIVRTSLKKLEQELPTPSLLRTHRSYMVNMDQLASVNRKNKGYEIWLNGPAPGPIPVSAGYKELFEKAVQSCSPQIASIHPIS
ncbi:LytTR family transcriptional regulator [Anseongella ginsenosidimutans]|uniref:LytTR family transcriptional regulator n=1 Tax=Anseongella ginsenosidimutans TaxID=496056 RepID=A0A4R3KYV3_9SPHI|nr:LytTR family DNA-binding domain-containing protein [Anseongella ginsenosidimutans]QEC51102.1 hypothetical protein FRZ59_01200 [Anseongella ginsenosidimutans]TCS90236.1 LytTR family transcriptional regulator [Anseongella ginsenosidimutans]